MTTADKLPRDEPVKINVRCDATCTTARAQRCQLYVGHEGEHAVPVFGVGTPHLYLWSAGQPSRTVPYQAAAGLPWAPGCPCAAPPGLRIVRGGDPSIRASPQTGSLVA
jgi:hypothetical protein